ncbi:4Fe-4S binding protein [Dehalogenimonas alkenigignens]|uniref:4Fe-4S binding protein n=1 Tax=Dehalogenimonas alkenigignens TaxID=1217799 RepID=UPI001403D77B|nr:4Fe-4S binding protein [Dehalogenimonas alkenigignens]
MKPDKASGSVGDIIKLEVTVALTHRNCPVPIADTKFKLTSNIKVTEQTQWVLTGRDTYKATLSVQLISPGTGKLEVIRDCVKEGGYASITITIGAAGAAAVQPSESQQSSGLPASETEPAIEPSGQADDEPEMSWGEAFKEAFAQPFIWAYLGLAAFAYAGLMMRKRRWRYISLAFSMVYLGFFLGLCPCSIGAMQNFVLHLGDAKQYLAQFIVLAIPIALTLFLGRLYCGWVCPMGAVQQFLYRKDLAIKLPDGLGVRLRKLRFVVLGGILIAALYTGTTAFAEIDPFKSLFNAQIAPVPTTLLALLIISSVFIFTPWCRFLCPMGAVLSVVAKLARRQVAFTAECKNCGACAKSFCDYKAIVPGKPLPVIAQNECARCGECLSRCPRGAMEYNRPEGGTSNAPAPSIPVPGLGVVPGVSLANE